MLEKSKNKAIITNKSSENISQTIEQDQYDSNHQLYLNTVSSTLRSLQSVQRSPRENCKTTMITERKTLIADVNKQEKVTKGVTIQERLQKGNKVNFELFKIITFENIGQDLNDNEILISTTKDTFTERSRSQLRNALPLPLSHVSLIEKGGIVNLDFQNKYNQDKERYKMMAKELDDYDIKKANGVLLIESLIKQYSHFNKRYLIKQLRSVFENRSNRGQCKALLRKLRKIQLRNNQLRSSTIIDKTLDYNEDNDNYINDELQFMVQSKKCFFKHSYYSKCFVNAFIISSITLIQTQWRKRRFKIIIKSVIDKFPLLKKDITMKREQKRLKINNCISTTSNRNNDCCINSIKNDSKPIMTINRIPSYSVSKINIRRNSLIEEKASLVILSNWRLYSLKQKQITSSILIQFRTIPSISFITKRIRKKKIALIDLPREIKAFINKFHTIIIKYNYINKKSFYRTIKNINEVYNKNCTINQNNVSNINNYHCHKLVQLSQGSLSHKVKFAYALSKILSKVIQEKVFYVFKLKNYNNTSIKSSLYFSFYYKTLRNHLMVAETFSNQNQIEVKSKLYVQLSLCQYFSLSSSLDFYSFYWKDKEKETRNEIALTQDIFKNTDKPYLISYIILFINTYYKQTIIAHPYLLEFIKKLLLHQKEQINTSIFGISRYIDDFIEAAIVQQIPFCNKCSCFNYGNHYYNSNNKSNTHCNMCDDSKKFLQRSKSNVELKGTKVNVTEQRIETFDSRRHIIKVSIEKTIYHDKKYSDKNVERRQKRYLDNIKFYNLAKETKFKVGK